MKTLINNQKCVVSNVVTILIVFGFHLIGYADVTPVKDRTPQVRDAIVAKVPGVNNAADVTKAHLAAITSLNLRSKGISVLKTGDFSGLTTLTSLNLYNNQLSSLPNGIFEELTSLTTIRLGRNAVDPSPFAVAIEKISEGQFRAVAPAGALFNIVLPITVTNGSVTGGVTKLTIPQGNMKSDTLTVTRNADTTAHVTVDIGTLPSPPRNHYGYALVKSNALPITIISGTNTAPVFTEGASTTRSIAENTATGQNIGTAVAAKDAENDTLIYILSGTDASAFDIDSTTGQLKTKAALDYETKNTYTVTITATDVSLTETITVTINITNVHEVVPPPPNSAPVFIEGSSTTRSIEENTATGQNIGTAVAATDADGHPLTYTLSGTDASSFSIVCASGQLQTRAALDYETKISYSVTITASDGRLTDSVAVTINVTDVNETINGPRFVPVADRSPEVRDAIVAALPNVSNAVEVTKAHVATIRSLNLRSFGIIALEADDFSGMTVLTSINLFNNQLSGLPPGIFESLTSLKTIRLGGNAVDPLPFIVSLKKVAEGQFRAVAPAGALFNIVLPITVTNGSVIGGATTLTIPQGNMESDTLTVTRTVGTTAHVTADIGTLPSLPHNHYGYALVKSNNLPLIIVRGPNTAPVFSEGATTTRSVAENTARGISIGAPVSATDADGDTLTYSFSGIDAPRFIINSSSGQLHTRAALDYETKTSYAVTVTASDSYGGSDSIIVAIDVTDVRENRAPIFTNGTSTTRTIAENTVSGQHIGSAVAATDADNDTLTYTLSGTDAASFGIDSTSGQLQTKAALDYEAKTSYSVTVSVSDGNGGSDSITVTINVTDVYENRAPVFTDGISTTRTIAENTKAGTNIGHAVSATDQDAKDTLTYTLSGTDAAAFDIDSTTGQIKTKAVLDFETKSTYSVTLTVSDELATDTIAVTINVTDVHENRAPVFTEGNSATRTVAENTEAGTNIGDAITATDPDNDTLTCSLGGQDASAFGMDTATGQLRTHAALDYETKSIYAVSVTVSDGKLTANIDVTINITDVDELPDQVAEVKGVSANNAPVFTAGSSTTRSIAENTANGTNIGSPISATDADNNTLTYSLGGTDAASFNIVSTSGQLQTNTALDYETRNSYFVTVSVSDGNGGSDSITVTINVTDVTEISQQRSNSVPIFTEGNSTTRAVAENTDSGVDIGTPVSATDADADTLTYSLGGTDANAFSINSTTGQLQTNTALDYETKNSYSVTVSVSDGNGGSESITVTINVTDVTERPPQRSNSAPIFTEGESTTRAVAENTTSGINIGRAFAVTDADNDPPTYSLSGADAASFSIVSTSGQLRTRAALNFESKTSYSVTVTASDGSLSDTISVTINVTNVNEAPNFTEGSSATRSVAENTTSGTNIGTAVSATDVDANTILSYTLGGTDASSFSIVSTSGQLQTSASLDYESKTSYSVSVSVSDGNGGSDRIVVTINVTDVDETPANSAPTFTDGSSTTRSIAENTDSGTNIGSAVAATDTDTGNTLTYTLGGTDAASFSIVSTSGQLQTSTALDYETKSSYSVSVSVSDGNGGSDSIAVTINVTNVNEAPSFATNTATRSIAENTASGQNIGSAVTATDVDANTTFSYTLGGTDAASFSIVSTSGQLRTRAALNFESKTSYSVTVTASDGSLSDTISVTINVTNVNEAPSFTDGSSTTRTIPENTASGTNIGTAVSATDVDANTTLSYTLGGTDASSFSIVSTSGQLQTSAALDYESKTSYSVSVSVSDGNGGSDSITVTINVTDVSEFTPVNERTQQVQDEIVASVPNVNNAADVTAAHLAVITSLTIDYRRITALKVGDFDGFTSLTNLVLKHNSISDLSALAKLTSLKWLFLGFNSISDLSALKKLTSLEWLYLHNNSISDISTLAKLTSLKQLFLSYNSISDISALEDLTALTWLDLSRNSISDISALEDLTALTNLKMDWNSISDISALEKLTALTDLNLHWNPIRDISVLENLTSLKRLILSNNWFSDISVLENLTALTELALNNNSITDVSAVENLTALTELGLSGNSISDYGPLRRLKAAIEVIEDHPGLTLDITIPAVANNNAPVFTDGDSTTRSVAENTDSGTNIGSVVAATDADTGDTLTYHLGGTDADSFRIVKSSGQIQTHAELDAETKSTYTVKVAVSDGKGGTDSITVTINVTDVANAAPSLETSFVSPDNTALLTNFPNPFNPETWVPYQIAEPAEITLTIYNMQGVVVRTIALGHKTAGVYTSRSRAIHWDGRNMFGEKVAAGTYFYSLTAGDFTATRKMLIRK